MAMEAESSRFSCLPPDWIIAAREPWASWIRLRVPLSRGMIREFNPDIPSVDDCTFPKASQGEIIPISHMILVNALY